MTRRHLGLVAVLVACRQPATTASTDASPPLAVDASVAVVDAAVEASTSPTPAPTLAKEAKKAAFDAKATGSLDGVAWKPTFAVVSVRRTDATIAVFDGPTPKCEHSFGDNRLQFLVTVPYLTGKKVDVSKLPPVSGMSELGQVSLFDLEKKSWAKRYAGTVELTSIAKEEGGLAHAKIDVRADAATLRGEFDAVICMYEE